MTTYSMHFIKDDKKVQDEMPGAKATHPLHFLPHFYKTRLGWKSFVL